MDALIPKLINIYARPRGKATPKVQWCVVPRTERGNTDRFARTNHSPGRLPYFIAFAQT
jgi:hypothetical protein